MPREAQHAGERGAVDERGAEVGLEEDEQRGHGDQANRAEHRPELAGSLGPAREEAREDDDHDDLAELGGLELEGAEVDPPPRLADRRRDDEDADHEAGAARCRAGSGRRL